MDKAQLKALAAFIDTHADYIADWLSNYSATNMPEVHLPEILSEPTEPVTPPKVYQVAVPQFKPGQRVVVAFSFVDSQEDASSAGIIAVVSGTSDAPILSIQLDAAKGDPDMVAHWREDRWYLDGAISQTYQVTIEPIT